MGGVVGVGAVVGSGVVDDHDEIWKPGYSGPPPASSPAVEPLDARPVDPSEQQLDRPRGEEPVRGRVRWRLAVAGAAAVVVAVVAALVVLDPFTVRAPTGDTEEEATVVGPPDRSVFAGAEDRRLPRTATELWTVEFDGVGDHWVEVIGRELVVVAIERPDSVDGQEPENALLGFDAITGEQRWTLPLVAGARDVAVVGSVDDLLVIEQPGVPGPIVAGIDMVTGEARWSTDALPNSGHVGLLGTRFVARLPAAPDRAVALIDASSGRVVAELDSDPDARGRPGGWVTDRRGTWYSIVDDVAQLVIASSELDPSTPVGVDAGTVSPIVVGDRLVVADEDGSIVVVGSAVGSDGPRPAAGSDDVPGPVRSFTAVSDSSFVVTAPGAIAGVVLEGDEVSLAWLRTQGVLADHHPVVGGTLLAVATRGGGAIELVDGRTGASVEQLVIVPGALQALEVAGDGYLALRTATLGTRVAAVGLDGIERWSILGPEPVEVGDRVAVRATSDETTLRVVTSGDAA